MAIAGGADEERREGGRSRPDPGERWQFFDLGFQRVVFWEKFILMAVTGLGYLALTWSTVVLLGGFVTALGKKDFWCLTVISMLQAARIFDDLAEHMISNLFKIVTEAIYNMIAGICIRLVCTDAKSVSVLVGETISLPFLVMCYVPVLVYGYGGPVASIALALWRIMERDYSSKDNGSLTPALDLFYSLVLFQGAIYVIWLLTDFNAIRVLWGNRQEYNLPDVGWSRTALTDYLLDARARCWRDPASIHGRTLLNFAVDLLDSGSWEDNLSGARLLQVFIRQGADIRSQLLLSRPKIQKLVDALGCRGLQQAEAREIRKLRKHAAHIVAHLASDIHLARFPGAIQCIASLLQDETTRTYWNSNQLGCLPRQSQPPPTKQAMIDRLAKEDGRRGGRDDVQQKMQQGIDQEGDGCSNELILQGLTILERLASDPHNCRDICSTPGLLPKITAPIYSSTLIQDIKISDWVDVVNGSFKVLNRLMCAPGKISRRLRREISTNKQAVSNLEGILDHGNEAGKELLMRAMEILTELALDISVNLAMETKQKLMKMQLQIFTADEGVETAAGMSNQLRATAGRTLALLTTSSETNSTFVMRAYDGIVAHLTKMLGANNNTYRTIAAEILENLCTHGELNQEHVTETLLPLVLAEALPSKRDPPQSNNSTPGNDEENQVVSAQRNNEVSHSVSLQVDSTEMQELSSAGGQNKSSEDGNKRNSAEELQEALLSLMLVICDNSPDDFDKVVEEKLGHSAFVAKLKTIVENCHATTAGCLRIVKLCGQIAISIMQSSQYMEHFKNQEFIKSLSESSKIMSNLESCVLYAGTDFGLKKTVRPLLIDIEEKARLLVG